MALKVGIPRGLFYYQYYPLWKAFLEELGAEIVLSDKTNKKILDEGVKSCVDEACLPVKLFHGHVLNLKNRVDYLFIPRFTSISRNEYVCPKFGGLPEMIKYSLSDIPEIINTEVNLRKSKTNSYKAAEEVGKYFTDDKTKIKAAYKNALNEYRNYRNRIREGILPDSSDKIEKRAKSAWSKGKDDLTVAVIGHIYNLYDNFINMEMLGKLKSNGVNVITVDMVNGKTIYEKAASNLKKRMFWSFGTKAVGTAFHILDRRDVDGIIYVMSFGCGVDSFVCDLIERKIRRSSNIPFIILTIDEHSGEAGMDTRLEAFTDMLRWRKRDEAHISTHG